MTTRMQGFGTIEGFIDSLGQLMASYCFLFFFIKKEELFTVT